MATSFNNGGSRTPRREPPTMVKQLVNFITSDCKSSASYFVIYKAGVRLECGGSWIRAPIGWNQMLFKIGICRFSSKHAALRRKSKNWLAWNQDNMSKWIDMSTIINIFLQCNLFCPWYSWKLLIWEQLVVRKDMDVNEYEILSNITLRHQLK
jgi:hypothetical protein